MDDRDDVEPRVQIHAQPMAMMVSKQEQDWVDQIHARSWQLALDRHHVRH